jgi:hypothetical protein
MIIAVPSSPGRVVSRPISTGGSASAVWADAPAAISADMAAGESEDVFAAKAREANHPFPKTTAAPTASAQAADRSNVPDVPNFFMQNTS